MDHDLKVSWPKFHVLTNDKESKNRSNNILKYIINEVGEEV